MRNTKHTPGPWRCGLATGSFSHYRVDAGDKTPVIAAVIESEDDARLIAAAPDLFDSLRSLAGAIKAKNEAAIFMHLGYADSILAKATGEA